MTEEKKNPEEKDPFEKGFDLNYEALGEMAMPDYIATRKAMKPAFHEQTTED